MEWLTSIALSWALDNIVPIVLTLLLGVVGEDKTHQGRTPGLCGCHGGRQNKQGRVEGYTCNG